MLRQGSPRHRRTPQQTNDQTTNQRKTKSRRFKKPPEPISQSNNTVNLSNKHLNQHHLSVLSKGLSFCPTPRPIHPCHILRDTFLFNRRVKLKYHFARNTTNVQETPTNPDYFKAFKPSSGWTPPPGKDLFLDAFTGNIINRISQLKLTTPQKNLTLDEINAFTDLKNDPNIVIKPADKGGATVVLNRQDYINEALRQLSNTNHYELSSQQEFEKSAVEIKNFLSNYVKNGHLPPYTHLHLTYKFPRLPQLYLLPKIHKRDNPGRPIISAVGCPTEKISAFVDSIFKPLVYQLPSYIRDTTDFINKIQHVNVPENHNLVTIDVSSLYTNIPHTEGILACRAALLNRDRDDPHTWFLLTLLRHVLTLNYFAFNGVIYHQTSGTAMGTKLAPNYANLFMGQLELDLIDSYPVKPTVWYRFIDDIFCVFPGTTEETQNFIDHLNRQHKTIKFTAEISNLRINFLDTTIIRNNDGSLSTTLYRKPTDTFQYLHFKSYHPLHQKRSIPYSQFVRVRRICSLKKDFFVNTDLMIRHFITRGYPMKLLIESQTKAANLNREDLLTPSTRERTQTIPYITTFSPAHQDVTNIIQNSLFLLENARPKIHHEYKYIVTARRSRNFRDLLTSSTLSDRPTTTRTKRGSQPCGRPRCSICQHVKTTDSVTSHSTGKSVRLPANTNCTTIDAVYMIECRACGIQYVGQTSDSILTRLRQHLRDIRMNDEYKAVSVHFNSEGHSPNDVIILGLDTATDLNARLRLEEAWIHVMNTIQPRGLNQRF